MSSILRASNRTAQPTIVGAGSAGRIVALAAVAALAGAIAELVTKKLDDNLTIPVAVGAALTLVTLAGF